MNYQIWIFAVLATVLAVIVYLQSPSLYQAELRSVETKTPLIAELLFSETPRINETATITLRITALADTPNITAKIDLSEGLTLVEGNLSWNGDVEKYEILEINATVISTEETIEAKSLVISPTSGSVQTNIYIGTYNSTHMIKYEKNATIIFAKPKRERNYAAPLPGGSMNPEPRKGEKSVSYFRSLNLTEDFYYVMIQFEGDGDLSEEQAQILTNDNIAVFEWHGDRTYYARVPRTVLENKSYDFVRWIEIPEEINASWKISDGRLADVYYKNCTGSMNLSIEFYQKIDENHNNTISGISRTLEYSSPWTAMNIEINITKLNQIVSLNFIKTIYVKYGISVGWTKPYDPFDNIVCIGA